VVEKNVPDAFINTGLERWLRVRDISSLVIVGVSTNNSVEATARSAGNLGFQTNVVSDATFAFDKIDYAGTLRGAAEVHAMSLANLDGEYARIVSTQEILNLL
jgi:nicotinamidase-related amidase